MNKAKLYKIERLLKRITVIKDRDERESFVRHSKGEDFCIFSVYGIERDEVHCHSALIAEFLNPNGAHGQGSVFLEKFLSAVKSNIKFDYSSVAVSSEYYIGKINKAKTYGGRLDIYIYDNCGNAIVVENKIDAADQKNQLLRYSNYCQSTHKCYEIYYLNKERYFASEKSTGNKKFKYIPISYRTEILEWLKDCLALTDHCPRIRETINQYITTIHNILYMMSNENERELVDLLTAEKNLKASFAVLKQQEIIFRSVRKQLIKQFEDYSKEKNWRFSFDSGFENYESDEGCYIRLKPRKNSNWQISIGFDDVTKKNGGLLIGVEFTYVNEMSPKLKKSLKTFIKEYDCGLFTESENEVWPLGYSYIYGPNGQPWWNLKSMDTMEDILNEKVFEYIRDRYIVQIMNIKVLNKLEKLVKEAEDTCALTQI